MKKKNASARRVGNVGNTIVVASFVLYLDSACGGCEEHRLEFVATAFWCCCGFVLCFSFAVV